MELAESVATMDAICGGRFIFGIGLGYRDEEYTAFRATFEKHVDDLNLLALDAVTAVQWRQIHQVLDVPWISRNSRQELRSRLRGVKSSTDTTAASASSSSGTESGPSELAGVWQAFWAIQTLSLAVPATTPATASAPTPPPLPRVPRLHSNVVSPNQLKFG